MRAVVQRVLSARVVGRRPACLTGAAAQVEGRVVSEVGPGLCVLVGLHEADKDADAEFICRRVLNMRLWPDEATGKAWDKSVVQRNYEVLIVSQFTLYGVLKGNKPDFHVAMPPQQARPFYAALVQRAGEAYRPDAVKDGIFGAMMESSKIISAFLSYDRLHMNLAHIQEALCMHEAAVWAFLLAVA
eukprot:SM000149S01345  [mRNA]  locus=s149:278184:279964:+ [translate_table: standard]